MASHLITDRVPKNHVIKRSAVKSEIVQVSSPSVDLWGVVVPEFPARIIRSSDGDGGTVGLTHVLMVRPRFRWGL
jgi:hypothetical protein